MTSWSSLSEAKQRALLRRVEKPARYTGGEWQACDKWDVFFHLQEEDRIRFAFCFPDLYEIGMSNLALQILYATLNADEHTWCERFFEPAPDMREQLIKEDIALSSLESGTPLYAFDIVGMSISYELAYTTVLDMLHLGKIPLRSVDRGERDPLVVAGGPVACNLEPMAPFFDLVMIGDGEELLSDITALYRKKKQNRMTKRDFLFEACRLEGIYVPAFYDVTYCPDGTIDTIEPNVPQAPRVIQKSVIRDLNNAKMPLAPIVPHLNVVHDRMVMEIFRGCARGCRFCQAGFTYRPMRERSFDRLSDAARSLFQKTGCDELGLLSLSTTDYSQLSELLEVLIPRAEKHHVNLSLPSLRLDAFERDMAEQVATTRRAGLTFAPEAGTQRLRDVINKNIVEEDLLQATEVALRNGWDRLKLYYMLGLPTETDDDVDGIGDMVNRLIARWREIPDQLRPRRFFINVSTSIFIPKPFTPFQWAEQISPDEMRDRQQRVASALGRNRRVNYQWHQFESSVLEAVLARGDRRLADVIEQAWMQGCVLDAWHEHFRWDVWEPLLSEMPGGTSFYTRERPLHEKFPWDHIQIGVQRIFLEREWRRAMEGKTTPACFEQCSHCGVGKYGSGVCLQPPRAATEKGFGHE